MQNMIETEHLILRTLRPAEAVIVSAFYSRNFDDFAKYEPLTRRMSLSTRYQRKVLELEDNFRIEGKRIRYYMFEKYDPFKTVGTVSFRELDKNGNASTIIGYKVDIEYRRRGYARETISTLIPLIEREYGVRHIKAEVLTTNIPSQNLLSGLGFKRIAFLKSYAKLNGKKLDEYIYERDD
ncbi:MAG: N-acetyltransferase [Lachnospiraceae bacterium]|uniref:GNAT family N-acetyltransferase n=1 Tax=Candidatus Weimeria bifida TaxID=2599074 RepID=A0A6N7J0I8_9FIRM|nr:GNAT family N-acetyltransferase [Candidatus Weimeria bifida]RRF96872.1 MAG: N-acetyltransferase [Lachnospiraceae bacterium]